MKRVFCGACLTAVAAVAGLVWPPHAAVAQAVAVPVPVPQAFAQQVFPQWAGAFAPDGEAIGDPWWDEAEAKRPDAKQAEPAEPADDAEAAEEPADAQAMLQQQLRAQAEAVAQHFRLQGVAILRRELSLVRQSCPSLEKQQRALVLEAGRGAIDRVVDEQLQAAGGGRRRRPARPTDLEASIRDALKASVKANASDAELAAYEAEHRLREERRKAAVIACIVAEVDREAYLDDGEREALAKTLAESYRERWRPAVAALEQQGLVAPDESILPGLERCVEKALGKERKAAWVTARDEARKLAGGPEQQNGRIVFGNGGIQVQGQVMVAPAMPAVRRVIRRQVQVGGGGVQVQVEVQVGAAAEAGTAEGAPAEAKEEEK